MSRIERQPAEWAGPALSAVLARAGATAAEVGPRFPLYADPTDRRPDGGRWTTTGRGSWTGGFWAGLLWLRARATGAAADRQAAVDCTGRLADWVERDTATRGLILWYGTALAGPAGAGLRDRAALACLDAFEPGPGVVPWGDAFGGPRLLARADGVPGLVPLLAMAGNAGAAAARSHLDRHLELCLREQPPRPCWQAGPDGGWLPGAEPPPGWSRTVPWLLLGAADGLHVLGGEQTMVTGLLAARSPAADTSAAAIEAVALLKLAALEQPLPGARDAAVRILERLTSRHLRDGRLLDGCYDAGHGLAVRHQLVWGDFFLALGLAILTGLVEPFEA
ncbi:sugar ABC transporter permease [Kitasatospora sp. NPDC002040]|uniref:sugar ABC transporter permease n=1 Tax=Kitasatospora sp. NPDC002040 TaxID=3154661 RepID=UPI00333225F7